MGQPPPPPSWRHPILTWEIVGAYGSYGTHIATESDHLCLAARAGMGVEPQADRLLQEAAITLLISNFNVQRLL
jgi:hypothetical protein